MLPATLRAVIEGAPNLYHLASARDARAWRREPGFPIVFVAAEAVAAEGAQPLAGGLSEALSTLGVELATDSTFDDRRYTLLAVVGAAAGEGEDPGVLTESFPYLEAVDGLLLWDAREQAVVLLDERQAGEAEAVRVVGHSPEALMESLAKLRDTPPRPRGRCPFTGL